MSVQSFYNAVVGFARDCKVHNSRKRDDNFISLHRQLIQSGYFESDDVLKFIASLDDLVKYSDVRRKKK